MDKKSSTHKTSSAHGEWSRWSEMSKCSCKSGSNRIRGLRISKRSCEYPWPNKGGPFCKEGADTKYVICSRNECTKPVVEELSSTVEAICQKASLEDPTILPFGDAQNTSSCRVHCFRVNSFYCL